MNFLAQISSFRINYSYHRQFTFQKPNIAAKFDSNIFPPESLWRFVKFKKYQSQILLKVFYGIFVLFNKKSKIIE